MKNLKGIGGWLILVAISVVATPFLVLFRLLIFPRVFSNEIFPLMSTGLKTLAISEALFFGVMFFVTIYIAWLFFSKDRRFPIWLIGVYLTLITFNIIYFVSGTILIPDQALAWPFDILAQMLGAAIWIPYLLKSKRVRLTFIEYRHFQYL